jgi:hypothetical protein
MLSLWTVRTFVNEIFVFSFFWKEKVIFCFCFSSARECAVSIENNGMPVPGVSNDILNDRGVSIEKFIHKKRQKIYHSLF